MGRWDIETGTKCTLITKAAFYFNSLPIYQKVDVQISRIL